MISFDLKILLERILIETFAREIEINNVKTLSGGCIHSAVKAETTLGSFVIKYNYDKDPAMFETEAKGLKLLRESAAINVPEVYSSGFTGNLIYLILEYIESAVPRKDYWRNFGASMAALHQKSNDRYGLHFDNFIGSLPQSNKLNIDWVDFFLKERLEPQVKLALNTGKIKKDVESNFQRLFTKLPDLLIKENPSLLHGDLWSGNVMINHKGYATIIDPAVYYGNREVELAFTQLFGGFSQEFYESYRESFPLQMGYEERFDIYNLYPLMVHVNLFDGGYLNSVINILRRFA